MEYINFSLLKDFIYKKCVERVERKRLSEIPPKPQIALCPDDKSLVSNFFNCKLGHNNKYLITERLLYYVHENDGIKGEPFGAVPVFGFSSKHEVLWGNEKEFNDNIFEVYNSLFTDIMNSSSECKETITNVLYDNIFFAKYYSLLNIKYRYKVSLLETFAVPDEMVNLYNMNIYLKIALKQLYEKEGFREQFTDLFSKYTYKYDDYTNIDKRITKDFIPYLSLLLKEYLPNPTSLGLRVKHLIETDLVKMVEQIDRIVSGNTKDATFEINKQIINASSLYITRLEEIAYSMLESEHQKLLVG